MVFICFEPVMTCQDPGNVEHSHRILTGNRFTVGSTVQFICNKGYILSGNSLLTCYNRDSANPKWSERLPKCVRKLVISHYHRLRHAAQFKCYCCANSKIGYSAPPFLSIPQLKSTNHAGTLGQPPPACRIPKRPSTRLERR